MWFAYLISQTICDLLLSSHNSFNPPFGHFSPFYLSYVAISWSHFSLQLTLTARLSEISAVYLIGNHLMGEKGEFPNILLTIFGKMLGSWILRKQFERFVQQFLLNKLQYDYYMYNRGHLDKVNILFNEREITIHSQKVSCQSLFPQNRLLARHWKLAIQKACFPIKLKEIKWIFLVFLPKMGVHGTAGHPSG